MNAKINIVSGISKSAVVLAFVALICLPSQESWGQQFKRGSRHGGGRSGNKMGDLDVGAKTMPNRNVKMPRFDNALNGRQFNANENDRYGGPVMKNDRLPPVHGGNTHRSPWATFPGWRSSLDKTQSLSPRSSRNDAGSGKVKWQLGDFDALSQVQMGMQRENQLKARSEIRAPKPGSTSFDFDEMRTAEPKTEAPASPFVDVESGARHRADFDPNGIGPNGTSPNGHSGNGVGSNGLLDNTLTEFLLPAVGGHEVPSAKGRGADLHTRSSIEGGHDNEQLTGARHDALLGLGHVWPEPGSHSNRNQPRSLTGLNHETGTRIKPGQFNPDEGHSASNALGFFGKVLGNEGVFLGFDDSPDLSNRYGDALGAREIGQVPGAGNVSKVTKLK